MGAVCLSDASSMSSGGDQLGHDITGYLAGRVAAFRTVPKLDPIDVMIPAVRGDETTTDTPASTTIDPTMLAIFSTMAIAFLSVAGCWPATAGRIFSRPLDGCYGDIVRIGNRRGVVVPIHR